MSSTRSWRPSINRRWTTLPTSSLRSALASRAFSTSHLANEPVRTLDKPAQVVKPETNQQIVWLEPFDLVVDQGHELCYPPAPVRCMATAGKFRVNPGTITTLGLEVEGLFALQCWCHGLRGCDTGRAVRPRVRPNTCRLVAVVLQPAPDTVPTRPVVLHAVRDGVADHHDLGCFIDHARQIARLVMTWDAAVTSPDYTSSRKLVPVMKERGKLHYLESDSSLSLYS